ncbi:MAG TPA: (5-formylfuran-3-yl)methyl phosphate synthase [Isosphaeraceae bacterium]|nr:(5-formylfuran-3-yl)methyl phosphate synthase [Isosphaeraceae bacterium]
MAKLLVSVRSADEAQAAMAGGAAIIDVKEPSRGSLGMAEFSVWRAVRQAVPASMPISVALGELKAWWRPVRLPPGCWSEIAFRKLGLACAGPDWRDRWRDLRERLDAGAASRPGTLSAQPDWAAVVYLDWEAARAPEPDAIIREAAAIEDCAGVLFDTWDKSRRHDYDASWGQRIARVKASGRFVALAGSLDLEAIGRLRTLEPDVFAVRGAACRAGDRRGPIDPERVARLAAAAARG